MSNPNDYMNNFLVSARYLDSEGRAAHGGLLTKIFSSPETKAGAVTAALSSCFAATAGNGEMVQLATISGVCFLLAQAIKPLHENPAPEKHLYYFDTAPDEKKGVPSITILSQLMRNKNNMVKRIMGGAVLNSLCGAGLYLITGNAPFSAMVTGNFAVAGTVGVLTKAWRTDQVLDGGWNALSALPPKDTNAPPPSLPTSTP